mgnify:CR=1 FL=1
MIHNDIDIGNWVYKGPRDFVIKLMNKFGIPSYIEKSPTTNEAYSVTFKNIDGFDMVRVLDSNTNNFSLIKLKSCEILFIEFSGIKSGIIIIPLFESVSLIFLTP